jgi:hypothetical protein
MVAKTKKRFTWKSGAGARDLFELARERRLLVANLAVRLLTRKYGMSPTLAATYAELHGFPTRGADE